MNAQAAATVRVCPVCGHRSHPSETGNHNCVSTLRQSLSSKGVEVLELRTRLAALQIELDTLRDLAGHPDPREGIRRLEAERQRLEREVSQSYSRGLRFGRRLALRALRPLERWPLLWRGRLRRAEALIEQAEDRKAG
ncbi:hypothetical protein BJP27_24580 (plasmid) [Pseudomonas oryzihabitans]|nr:hypothetical protein BJP27_23930 [Pseudomonas psychrotolerans]APQ14748.1 hypothetical protein BJP27_24580 [Pseudomonas psychrotolerans]